MLHPDRYSVSNIVLKKLGVVVHDSESGDGSALNLKAALERPGDRDNGKGGVYGSGYHALSDGFGGYIEMATASMGPHHAPPLNKTWWSICMPGYAKQTREEWLDETSYNHIKGVAKYIVDKSKIDGFQIKKLTVAELKLPGAQGYCAHKDVSDGWGQTNHYDPGPNFPWDILDQEIKKLLTPIEPSPAPTPPTPPIDEEEMTPIRVRFKGYLNVFLYAYNRYTHLTVDLSNRYNHYEGVLVDAHPQGMKAALNDNGLDMSDMVAGGSTDVF